MTSPFGGAASACLLALVLPTGAIAQQRTDPTGDIVVALPSDPRALPLETRHGLDARAIDQIAANTGDEIVRRLPSTYVPVNSRREAIAFVRNAAERQVALFYDGAAINVPWDNRLDLSLFPAALAGSAQVAAAPLAPAAAGWPRRARGGRQRAYARVRGCGADFHGAGRSSRRRQLCRPAW